MSRKVIIVSGQSSRPVTVENFEGNTWGELRERSEVNNLLNSNLEAVCRQNGNTLSREDAQLPSGDVTIFLVPTKNKAGMSPEQAQSLGEQIANAIAKAAVISSENDVEGLKEELVEAIANFFDVDEADIVSEAAPVVAGTNGLTEEEAAAMNDFRNFRY